MTFQTVFATHYLDEIYFVKTLLDNAQIQNVILDENISSLAPHLIIAIKGPKLAVNKEDAEEAFAIINDYLKGKHNLPRELSEEE